ncbi:MAG: hypothetical protein P8Y64_10700 [Gammaproteobacteria bacterium]|jgi:hypothetical protein
MDKDERLAERFEQADEQIAELESSLREDPAPELSALLDAAMPVVLLLLRAYAEHAGKPVVASDDALEVFKSFVKGDPSLNAVRDNIRELVYYRNCLAMDRADALPAAPERMVVHTLRHLYFYLHSRCEQEKRFS